MTVAIVILNFNGSGYLQQFIPGVIAHSTGARIIVADNGSKDGSLLLLEKEFPTVECIALPHNLGFCQGYNEALKQVEADYFVLLNSDVETTPGWLEPVLSQMEANPAIAAAQPKIRSFRQRDHFEYAGAAGGHIDWLGYPFCRGRVFDTVEKDEGQYNEPEPIFWATGACLFIRAGAFREAGGFDGDFFAHMEEIDLCWRLRRKGFTILAVPQSVVYHVGGGTLAADNPQKTYYNFRNGLTLLLKNLPAKNLLIILPLRLLLDWAAMFRFFLSGYPRHGLAVMRAHIEFVGNSRRHLKKRNSSHTPFFDRDPLIFRRSVVLRYFIARRQTYHALLNQ